MARLEGATSTLYAGISLLPPDSTQEMEGYLLCAMTWGGKRVGRNKGGDS